MTSSLLSRRQLSLLILILPGLILWLSLAGPNTAPPFPPRQHDSIQRLYQQKVPDQDHYRLHLLLPLSPAATARQQLEQQLLIEALQVRLQSLPQPPQVQRHPGHLRLEIRAPTAPDDVLSPLLQHLQQPPALDWQARLNHLQARQYLQRQQPEGWLLGGGQDTGGSATWPNPAEHYRHWVAPERWQFSLSGPDRLARPLMPTHPAATTESAPEPNPELTFRVLPVTPPDGSARLLRWPLTAPETLEQLALTLLAREYLQQRLSATLEAVHVQGDSASGFSLSWIPVTPGGQASLLLQGPAQDVLTAAIQTPVTSTDLHAARTTLASRLDDMQRGQAWLDLLALYRLAADSFDHLDRALADIDATTLQRWLQAQRESDYYHVLSLPAAP
ncbi:peptidase M16 family protein [Marinobacterium weihaiense]|uniref:Uncharacterized protein n=1 Tax=Marinobacterium weihaiense TaxID=2851016 RepID=A0ABS6MFN3_9GAMM|nr:hypothetical protein [Marinobacterium weihaiense]MBV0934616.1 hypothetical protein [Marinobacterium weihaiense]